MPDEKKRSLEQEQPDQVRRFLSIQSSLPLAVWHFFQTYVPVTRYSESPESEFELSRRLLFNTLAHASSWSFTSKPLLPTLPTNG